MLNLDMQIFTDLVQKKHFQIGGWTERDNKMCVFSGKLAVSRKRWELRKGYD